MSESYDEWGRDHWAHLVQKAGFFGSPGRLFEAMTDARDQFSTGVTAEQIAEDPQRFSTFCDSVDRVMARRLPRKVIREGLLAMPRACFYCSQPAWEWCNDCGGCPECCDSEVHCPHCGGSELICGCPIQCRCC